MMVSVFVKEDGTYVIKPQREKLDLKTIPSPYRFPEDIPHLSKRITYIETSRGCPFSCQFLSFFYRNRSSLF
ncbi:hypothetical protein GCM10020331_072580 [Ectobacillus funiculus]